MLSDKAAGLRLRRHLPVRLPPGRALCLFGGLTPTGRAVSKARRLVDQKVALAFPLARTHFPRIRERLGALAP